MQNLRMSLKRSLARRRGWCLSGPTVPVFQPYALCDHWHWHGHCHSHYQWQLGMEPVKEGRLALALAARRPVRAAMQEALRRLVPCGGPQGGARFANTFLGSMRLG